MSYRDTEDVEAQSNTFKRNAIPTYQDDPEFERFTRELFDKLFTLTSNISNLTNQIQKLGTKKETERVRERVQDLLEETSNGFKEVGTGVKKVLTWEDLEPSQRYTQGKLEQEFKASLVEFRSVQDQAISKQKAKNSAARAAIEDQSNINIDNNDNNDDQQLLLQQEQQQLRLANQNEVDFQEQLIVERESEIRNIEESVRELNDLFRDVAHMVNEQGNTLETIEGHVTNVRDDTRGADIQLKTASRYQKNARSKMCCLLIILAIILTVVILAAVLS